MRVITEQEFADALRAALPPTFPIVYSVTGPGRSGAIASVYAAHHLGVAWYPHHQPVPQSSWPVLVIDTARKTGATLRKAARRTGAPESMVIQVAIYEEPPRLRFWYERKN